MKSTALPGFTAERSVPVQDAAPVQRSKRRRYIVPKKADNGMHDHSAKGFVNMQWTTLTCPNASLQTICSAAFYPADFSCAWLGWFSHSAELHVLSVSWMHIFRGARPVL